MLSQNETKKEIYNAYLQGFSVSELATKFNTPARTIYNWINVEKWGSFRPATPIKLLEKRLSSLITRENKTDSELKEITLVLTGIECLQRIEASGRSPEEVDKKSRKKKSNDLSDITDDEIVSKFKEGLFNYQLDLWETREERNRFILKSRQIGLTYYFAAEAFVKGVISGKNQIFLSASRAQSENFRLYIKSFCKNWFNIELKGKDNIVIRTGRGDVTFTFLSTNSATAQSYHGDVYIDEAFWIPKFN